MQVGRVTVAAPPNKIDLAITLAEVADHPLDLPGLGRRTVSPLRLILVPDSQSLAALFRDKAPAWGAALAVPAARTIVLRTDLGDLQRTLRHELAHLALHDAVSVRVPLWFDEGYAAWAGGEWDRLELLRLNLAVASGVVPDLRELDARLRGSASVADIAYALAVSAVLELARRNPSGRLDPLLTRLADGEDFGEAVVATTGLTLDRFDEVWRQSLHRRYNLVAWLLAGGVWGVLAFLLAGLLWFRRRSDDVRREALNEGWVVPDQGDGEGEGPS